MIVFGLFGSVYQYHFFWQVFTNILPCLPSFSAHQSANLRFSKFFKPCLVTHWDLWFCPMLITKRLYWIRCCLHLIFSVSSPFIVKLTIQLSILSLFAFICKSFYWCLDRQQKIINICFQFICFSVAVCVYLHCSKYPNVIAGSPPPVVIWRSSDGRIIDETYESLGAGTNTVRNSLSLPRIDRSHLRSPEITCEAFPPLVSSVPTSSSTHPVLSSPRHSSLSFIRRSSIILDLNRKFTETATYHTPLTDSTLSFGSQSPPPPSQCRSICLHSRWLVWTLL